MTPERLQADGSAAVVLTVAVYELTYPQPVITWYRNDVECASGRDNTVQLTFTASDPAVTTVYAVLENDMGVVRSDTAKIVIAEGKSWSWS